MKNKLMILAISLLLVSGCIRYAEVGNPNIRNQEMIEKIEIGKTTRHEIENKFGTHGDLHIIKGKKMWVYTFFEGKMYYGVSSNFLNRKVFQLQVFYDENEVVSNFNYVKEGNSESH